MMVLWCLINALCWGHAEVLKGCLKQATASTGCQGLVTGKCILNSIDVLLLQIDLCPSRDIFRLYIALHSVAA
jgi:hypothetical protein